jgi:hypothetical protein
MIVGWAKEGYYMNLESAQQGYWRSALVEQRGQAIKTTGALLRLPDGQPIASCAG